MTKKINLLQRVLLVTSAIVFAVVCLTSLATVQDYKDKYGYVQEPTVRREMYLLLMKSVFVIGPTVLIYKALESSSKS